MSIFEEYGAFKENFKQIEQIHFSYIDESKVSKYMDRLHVKYLVKF